MSPLDRSFYDRDTVEVARELLGMYLVYIRKGIQQVGKIVETEAYLGPHDLASHSSRGRTNRTEVMFGPPGHAYVYLIYGVHHCMNVVTEREGHASAVLIRALEPIEGIDGKTHGPGLLCQAMRIDRSVNGWDLCKKPIFITPPPKEMGIKIEKRPRIGVNYAGIWARRLLRFYIRENPWVSRP